MAQGKRQTSRGGGTATRKRSTNGRRATRSTARKTGARTAARKATRKTTARKGTGRTTTMKKAGARKGSTRKTTGRGTTARRTTKGTGSRQKKMDAITFLKHDHREVEGLFARYRKLGSRSTKTKEEIVQKVIRELSIHAAIEEQLVYPQMEQMMGQGKKKVDHALDEHQEVKEMLAQLEQMTAEDEQMDTIMEKLEESVSEHVEEEETDLFPKFAKVAGREELEQMGEQLRMAKRTAPTRPHPNAPNRPPGNIVMGMASAAMDRARDAGRTIAGRMNGE
ncbi:MAG: hemerythrin domain-containing protein [Actinomycetota bacterium]